MPTIADIYELSPIQKGLLFHSAYAPESSAYFDQFACRLEGDLDPDAFRKAWQLMVDRHAIFRTSFHWEQLDKPVQVVHREALLDWELLDWRGIDATAQSEAWRNHLQRDRTKGFQLNTPHLMRCSAARVADDTMYFCWSHHHLLLDGWCLSLVLNELFEHYAALRQGKRSASARAPQYREYITWLQQQDPAAAEHYWRENLKGLTAPTRLPGNEQDNAAETWADGLVRTNFPESFSSALSAFAARNRLTLNVLFQGAWSILLARYCGEADVAFGATVSGRPPQLADVETILGTFINTVPVRVRLDPQSTLVPWLQGLQAQQAVRESHGHLPLSDIQKLSEIEAGKPLFESNVVFINYRRDESIVDGMPGVRIRDVQIFDRSDLPLSLEVTPGRQIETELTYNSGRFDRDVIERMLGHLQHLLGEFVSGAERRISEFEILTDTERKQILEQFNGTAAPLDDTTLPRAFEKQAAKTPDAIALEFEGRATSFANLNARANRLARTLLSQADLQPDDLVAVMMPRTDLMALAILAIWKCGAAYMPIEPNYPEERIRSILDEAKPKLVLTDGRLNALLITSDSAEATNLDQDIRPGNLAYVIFTSGSTGKPKGAMIEHAGMMNHMLSKLEVFGLGPDSAVAQTASHCFDISVWQFFAAMLAGGKTVIYASELVLEPTQFLARLASDRIGILEVVPSYLSELLDCLEADGSTLPGMRWLLVTGEMVKPALLQRWFKTCPRIPAVNAYGPAEAADDISYHIMHEAPPAAGVPIGKAIRNLRIYIVNGQMQLCPVGIKGEICVAGIGVGRGYLNDPARTSASFVQDPFHPDGGRMYKTGDIGSLMPDGSILFFGRQDFQVKVRGHRIELGDIESALTRIQGVREAAVIDRHDRGTGTTLCAYVVLHPGQTLTADQIVTDLARKLPGYMIPTACILLDEMPLNANGKIDRKALPAPSLAAERRAPESEGPRNPVEALLASIWQDVLGVENPGIYENFFTLGGDSILSMQVVSRASRAGLRFTPRDLFQSQTIAELGAVAQPVSSAQKTPRKAPDVAPLSPVQQRFFETVTVDRHHYNQSLLLETPADFDATAFRSVLGAAIEQHESLRLRFRRNNEHWEQFVAPFSGEVPFHTSEVSSLSALEEEAAKLQASLDLEAGPILRAAHFDLGSGTPGRLLLIVHHLVMDGVSWRILLDDLESREPAPQAASYLDWATRIHALPRAVPRTDTPPALTVDHELGPNTVESEATYESVFEEHAASAELMLSALTRTFGGVVVDVETHGRDEVFPDLDLTRTIGWFTSISALALANSTADDSLVATVKQQLRRSPRHRYEPQRARIAFNFHGRTEQSQNSAWRLSRDPHGLERSLRQIREYVLEINAYIVGGQLHVEWGYSRNQYKPETIEKLAEAFRQHLQALAACDVEDAYALSPTQQGMLFHTLQAPNSRVYFNQMTCVVSGKLDVPKFREAWRRASDRHAALRSSFHWHQFPEPVQIVHRQAEAPWQVQDWQEVGAASQTEKWSDVLARDRAAGFDLNSAPLMRFILCRTGQEEFRFCWTQHHLLLDGWSAAMVLNDVMEIYETRIGSDAVLKPPPPSFRDAVDWLDKQDVSKIEAYWRSKLGDFTTPTALLAGLPELEGSSTKGIFEEAEIALSTASTKALRELATKERITLNTIFQGIWAILLSRFSNESDVVFGSIASGRPAELAGSDDMVGVFINTVPVRARLNTESGLMDWLRAFQSDQAEAAAYSYSPLADVQRWSGIAPGAALFESIMIFENYPVEESLKRGEKSLAIRDVRAFEPNNYPLTFVVTPGETLGLKLMYDSGRFDRATAERILEHCRTLAEAKLSIVPEADDHPLLDLGNGEPRPLPENKTVLDLFLERVAATPAHIAVECGDMRLTYAELDRQSSLIAARLRRAGSLQREDRVAVVLPRSERLLAAILAIWKRGTAYVPIDPAYPQERIQTIIRNSRAALVVDEAFDWSDSAAEPDVPETPPCQSDLAYVIYTSGSTGVPKGAMVEHGGMLNHVLSMIEDLQLDAGSRVAQTASHCFDISIWQFVAALVAGGTTVIYPEEIVTQPSVLAERMESNGITAAQFVPSYLNVFLDEAERMGGKPRLGALRHMVLIGETLKKRSVERWFALFPHVPLMNAYGPTEASDSITHHLMDRPPASSHVPIGRPVRNLSIRVVHITNGSMKLCPPGVKGEICVSGVGVGRGYLFDEERTREVFVQDAYGENGERMYRTGDVGCFAADGTMYFFGRKDSQVKVRGHRIELGEIEACLTRIAGVRDAAVIARHAANEDSLICAFVTVYPDNPISSADIAGALASQLPRYMLPALIRILPELPVLPNGKTDRRALASSETEDAARRTFAPPSTADEIALARIWREVLNQDEIGIDDSFFDIGGHSIRAIQIVSRIRSELNAEVTIADVFEATTIRELSPRLRKTSQTRPLPIERIARQDDYEVSRAQKRLWLSSQTPSGSVALNMAGAYAIKGSLDIGALERAFGTLVERHEALRTVFRMSEGTLRQFIIPAEKAGFKLRHAADDTPSVLASLVQEPFDLSSGPLFAVDLLGSETARTLLIRMHHIVGDAWSIHTLFHEALSLYAALRKDVPNPLQALPIQYKDFAHWHNGRLNEDEIAQDRDYWRANLADLPRTSLSPTRPKVAPREGRGQSIDFQINPALTSGLRKVATEEHTTLYALLLSGLFGLIHRYTGQEDLIIGMPVSGRDHPLLENQIGCYINTVIVRAGPKPSDTGRLLLRKVKASLNSAIEHQAYPFDALVEDIGEAMPFEVFADHATPTFRVHGLEKPLRTALASLAISEVPLPIDKVQYPISFLFVESDTQDSVFTRIEFDASIFEAASVEKLGSRLMALLEWLATGDSRTLIEIDLVGTDAGARPRRVKVQLNIG